MDSLHEDDSDDYENLYPKKFIQVENVPGFDPKVHKPRNGQEYLLCVVKELKEIPAVKVADNCDKLQKKNKITQDMVEEKIAYELPQNWVQFQISEFRRARAKISIMREYKDTLQNTNRLQLENTNNFLEQVRPSDLDKPVLLPYISLILDYNDAELCTLLEILLKSFFTGFTENVGRWIYAIFACLQAPLFSDTCSLMRNIARSCLQIVNLQVDEELKAGLNLIICIVAKYFGQSDLLYEAQ